MPELKKPKHESFAVLFVSSGENVDQIANAYNKAGYVTKDKHTARKSGMRLLQTEIMQNRIRELRDSINSRVEDSLPATIDESIKTRVGRIETLARDLAATEAVIAARAISEEVVGVPGGSSGHVVTGWTVKGNIKTIDEKGRTTITPDYVKTHSVDVKLIAERRALLDQIAQELGQKMDKKQQVPMTEDELKELPVFQALLERSFNDAEKAGLLDEPSPEDKEAVEDLLNGKV